MGGAGVEMRIPGAVRATGIGAQLKGGASGVCETRGSHRAVAGGLGKGLAGKSAMEHATEIAARGFTVAVGCCRAIKLKIHSLRVEVYRIYEDAISYCAVILV